MEGEPSRIAFDFLTALASIWLISAGVVGYGLRVLNVGERAINIVAGAMLLIPASIFANAVWINLAGLALGGSLVAREVITRRKLLAAH